jgi:hypothetical protein
MSDKRLEALLKIGTPPEILGPLQDLVAGLERIRSQQFKPEKEQGEIAQLTDHQVRRLHERREELIARIEKESNAEIAALDQEIAQASAIPAQRLDETASEYSALISKRNAEEVQAARRATFALMDFQSLQQADHVEALNIFDRSLSTKDPAVVPRIGVAVERRLFALSAEAEKSGDPDRSAFMALLQVQTRLKAWREAEAARSPEGRRQQAHERSEQRKAEVHRSVKQAAEHMGLHDRLAMSAKLASIGR